MSHAEQRRTTARDLIVLATRIAPELRDEIESRFPELAPKPDKDPTPKTDGDKKK